MDSGSCKNSYGNENVEGRKPRKISRKKVVKCDLK